MRTVSDRGKGSKKNLIFFEFFKKIKVFYSKMN